MFSAAKPTLPAHVPGPPTYYRALDLDQRKGVSACSMNLDPFRGCPDNESPTV